MSALLAWLKSDTGLAFVCAAAYVLTAVIARYAPRTPFWNAVRSIVADYAQKNLSTLPPELTVRVDAATAEVVLFVGGREVRREPMVRVVAPYPAVNEIGGAQ